MMPYYVEKTSCGEGKKCILAFQKERYFYTCIKAECKNTNEL